MEKKELNAKIIYLINKYIADKTKREDLINLFNEDIDSVKYILAELDKFKIYKYNDEDLEIIKDIVYYYV